MPPFPSRLRGKTPKVDKANQEILEIFRTVEINIPLLDAIKQVPRYAKFFKELFTAKCTPKGNEKVSLGENVFAVLQKTLNVRTQVYSVFLIKLEISLLVELRLI